MKKKYYVNRHVQSNGDHEVHDETCLYLSRIVSKLDLGEFYSCEGAVMAAKRHYLQVDGCYYCSPTCHNS